MGTLYQYDSGGIDQNDDNREEENMQRTKKKLPAVIKILLAVILVILLAVGAWLADYFLIPKIEKTGIKAPVDYHTEVTAAETDTTEETAADQTGRIR